MVKKRKKKSYKRTYQPRQKSFMDNTMNLIGTGIAVGVGLHIIEGLTD